MTMTDKLSVQQKLTGRLGVIDKNSSRILRNKFKLETKAVIRSKQQTVGIHGYCMSCRAMRLMVNPTPAILINQRKIFIGTCRVCKTEIIRKRDDAKTHI